ncbi:hypothetical protein FOA52_012982 [Chlamydomonas sp. UWO 241]|nr:hypothetical protein FOA52_012982 [Chlamydomonas sp. UWO 241]
MASKSEHPCATLTKSVARLKEEPVSGVPVMSVVEGKGLLLTVAGSSFTPTSFKHDRASLNTFVFSTADPATEYTLVLPEGTEPARVAELETALDHLKEKPPTAEGIGAVLTELGEEVGMELNKMTEGAAAEGSAGGGFTAHLKEFGKQLGGMFSAGTTAVANDAKAVGETISEAQNKDTKDAGVASCAPAPAQ